MDSSTLKNITNFLGGGWLSVALSVLLIGFLLWWAWKKHSILVDAATKETEKQRDQVEGDEQKKTVDQDTKDKTGRDATDTFLSDDPPPKQSE